METNKNKIFPMTTIENIQELIKEYGNISLSDLLQKIENHN